MKKFVAASVSLVALLGAAFCVYILTSEDPRYLLRETIFFWRYDRYDDLIRQASERYSVAPELIKAVIWRESQFQPRKVGSQGERGLMQITEKAAVDWARAEKIQTFVPTDLFDPKVNIEAGTWYLGRALKRWSSKDDPVPFALAEYNAGLTRVQRWVQGSGRGETAGAGDLQAVMDFPSTKNYIAAISARYDYYKRRGEFLDSRP
ncbi:MAG TPA: lytic transglycosylase domain-containing protein [Terrimicrobiaceae bacterium]|jgi:soluble lytic murein transglycosylase|nr:lytic transglycosylase domain-containing protein [Terrimicrobiaceae bacterium]